MVKKGKKNKGILVFISLLIIFIVLAIYYYVSIYNVNFKTLEDKRAVKKVNSMMLLPSDETPTVATVTDPAKLKGQLFFINSQAGDKVIIYTKIRKAILFRPSTSKIIEVAPVQTIE